MVGGALGNVFRFVDQFTETIFDYDVFGFSYGCLDWQEFVNDAITRVYARVLRETPKNRRCFMADTRSFPPWVGIHHWIVILTPRDDGGVVIDPWPSGGSRLFRE